MDQTIIPQEIIENKIYLIRVKKVMLDIDLAKLYKVPVKRLNEQVKRNPERFPEDFMFRLTQSEYVNLKSQIATSSWGGRRKLPSAFTENGVAMLSSILNSKKAILVNVMIMRTFTRIREWTISQSGIFKRLYKHEVQLLKHERQISEVIRVIDEIQSNQKPKTKKRIGFLPPHCRGGF